MLRGILFAVVLLISLGLKAQFSVGYRYGIGNHGVNFEPDDKWQVPYQRTSHGLILTYNNENNAGVQLEINYAQKGWKEEVDSIAGDYYVRNLDYIEIPIYAHFEIGHRMIRPVIIGGPYVGFQLNDTWDQNDFEDKLNSNIYKHYHQKTQKFDYGMKIGIGLRVNVHKRFAVFGEVHYDLELAGGSNIFKGRPEDISISRMTEISGVFGVLWHFIPQKERKVGGGYTPKEDLYLENY